MTVEYDFDIPAPSKMGSGAAGCTEILANMPIGGSYFFENVSAKNIHSARARLKKRHGMLFRGKALSRAGVVGYRIWRVGE